MRTQNPKALTRSSPDRAAVAYSAAEHEDRVPPAFVHPAWCTTSMREAFSGALGRASRVDAERMLTLRRPARCPRKKLLMRPCSGQQQSKPTAELLRFTGSRCHFFASWQGHSPLRASHSEYLRAPLCVAMRMSGAEPNANSPSSTFFDHVEARARFHHCSTRMGVKAGPGSPRDGSSETTATTGSTTRDCQADTQSASSAAGRARPHRATSPTRSGARVGICGARAGCVAAREALRAAPVGTPTSAAPHRERSRVALGRPIAARPRASDCDARARSRSGPGGSLSRGRASCRQSPADAEAARQQAHSSCGCGERFVPALRTNSGRAARLPGGAEFNKI